MTRRRGSIESFPDSLQEIAKLLDRKAGIARNTAHCESVHRIVAGNGHDALTITHDDVLSLTRDPEACLLQYAYGVEMIDAGDTWQD